MDDFDARLHRRFRSALSDLERTIPRHQSQRQGTGHLATALAVITLAAAFAGAALVLPRLHQRSSAASGSRPSQVFYVATANSAATRSTSLGEVTANGSLIGHLTVDSAGTRAPGYLPSPDGSRVLVNGFRVVDSAGTLLAPVPPVLVGGAVQWADESHLCRLDPSGPDTIQLSLSVPGGNSSDVAQLPRRDVAAWRILSCSTAADTVVIEAGTAGLGGTPRVGYPILHEAVVLRLSTGAMLLTRPYATATTPDLTVSPDGRWIAETSVAATKPVTTIVDTRSGQIAASLAGIAVRFSSDGRRLLLNVQMPPSDSVQAWRRAEVVVWSSKTVVWSGGRAPAVVSRSGSTTQVSGGGGALFSFAGATGDMLVGLDGGEAVIVHPDGTTDRAALGS